MRVIRDWQATIKQPVGAVAIGNFDGVHIGHQALIKQCQQLASGRPVGVVSFHPLPVEVLFPEQAPGRVSSTRQRIEDLQAYGVDLLWLLRFNHALARQSPQAFVERILVEGLGAKHVVIGEDFRFGFQRAGDMVTLQEAGEKHGFSVHVQATIEDQQQRVSSTQVRAALRVGAVDEVASKLGRAYSISGRVIRGQQLGRKLGFPTLNIDVSQWQCLLTGVFAVLIVPEAVELRNKKTHNSLSTAEQPYLGVASIGFRPTITDTVNHNRHLLEVHIFDWAGDAYGQRVRVTFVARLRDELQFADVTDMTQQIQRDAEQARAMLIKEVT